MKQAVEDVARRIRLLLRHDKMSIVERHTLRHVAYADADKLVLRELCRKLLKCAGLVKHFRGFLLELTFAIFLKVRTLINHSYRGYDRNNRTDN